ncbi:MAG: hypothetical protein ABW075_03365 [Aeromicrobium sp.]
MTDTALRYVLRRGRIRLRTRHELCEVRPDGSDGGVIATIQLGEMGDDVGTVFYADPEATRPMFAFTGSILRESFDVTDDTGVVLGSFRKEWKKSFFRSTWHLTTSDGLEAVGRERSRAAAIGRRISDDIPFLVSHFDFVTSDGHTVFSSLRRRTLWPEYELTAPLLPDGRQLDWRMAAAMGAALEIIQSR